MKILICLVDIEIKLLKNATTFYMYCIFLFTILQIIRDPQGLQAKKESLVLRVNQAHLVLLERGVRKEKGGKMVRRVRMAYLEHRVIEDKMVPQVCPAEPEEMVKVEKAASQVR